MRMLSMTKIWTSKFISSNQYGEQVGGYTNLKEFNANVQYMSNDIEFKTYGEITNSIITIRLENEIKLDKGDYIYLNKPTVKGNFEVDGKDYNDYGIGEYQVESIKPTYIGGSNIKNRTYITARKI